MPKWGILNVANVSFYAIHENKILAKISEFTVWSTYAENQNFHQNKFSFA